MAKKSTKTAVNSTESAIETKVEDIKTEDKTAETMVAEEKEPEKKTRTRKTPAKTAESKGETVKKEASKAEEPKKEAAKSKGSAKKAELTCSLSVQYKGREIGQEYLLNTVREIWKNDLNREAGELNSVELYVKPEEDKAYYVLNKEITGSIDI